MTTRNTPPKRTGTGGRPQKIIDLEAREVSGQDTKSEAKPDPKKPASGGKTAASKTETTTKTASGTSQRSTPQDPAKKPGNIDSSHVTRHLPLVLAAIAGGIITLAGNSVITGFSNSADQQGDDIAALSGKIEASGTSLREEITKIQSEAENKLADLDGVTKKLSQQFDTTRNEFAELTKNVSASTSGNSEFSEGLKALDARMASAEKLLKGLADNPGGNAGANTVQLQAFRAELEKQTGEIKAMNDRISDLSVKADNLEANALKLEDATEQVRNIRDTQISAEQARLRRVTANVLQDAHVNGQDITSLLDPARTMLTKTDAIDKLQSLATDGIPTNEDLISGFRLKLRAILVAAGKEPEGLVGKFLSNAMTLVTIKPAGPVAGDNPAAIASRIDAALGAGQFADALKEWETLPEQGREISQDWQNKLKSRIEADRLLDQIVTDLKSGNTNEG